MLRKVFLIIERRHRVCEEISWGPRYLFSFFPGRGSFYLCRWLFRQRLHLPASLAARYGHVAVITNVINDMRNFYGCVCKRRGMSSPPSILPF